MVYQTQTEDTSDEDDIPIVFRLPFSYPLLSFRQRQDSTLCKPDYSHIRPLFNRVIHCLVLLALIMIAQGQAMIPFLYLGLAYC